MMRDFISNHYQMDKTTIRDKLMIQSGGGDNMWSGILHLLIGIILITVGFILYKSQNQWNKTDAKILEIIPNNKYLNLKISYQISESTNINSIIKNVTVPKSDYRLNEEITIYYDKSDPNIIKVKELNYKYLGIIIGTIGVLSLAGFF